MLLARISPIPLETIFPPKSIVLRAKNDVFLLEKNAKVLYSGAEDLVLGSLQQFASS